MMKFYFMMSRQLFQKDFYREQVIVISWYHTPFMHIDYCHNNTHIFHIYISKTQLQDRFSSFHFKIRKEITMIYKTHLVFFGIADSYFGFAGEHIAGC